ncbi:hypothetical protein BJV74DRAFT_799253 [Russula compacta]|nr:hypothetical protein BJV74DRAFT_799253 [Russula compacta]
MHIFRHFKPQKFVEHGDQQVEAARHLLIFSSAEDFKQTLDGKHLLERIKRARRYDRKASEARHIIENLGCSVSPELQTYSACRMQNEELKQANRNRTCNKKHRAIFDDTYQRRERQARMIIVRYLNMLGDWSRSSHGCITEYPGPGTPHWTDEKLGPTTRWHLSQMNDTLRNPLMITNCVGELPFLRHDRHVDLNPKGQLSITETNMVYDSLQAQTLTFFLGHYTACFSGAGVDTCPEVNLIPLVP